MAFEDIDFVGTPSATAVSVPADGVRVAARSVGQRGGGHAHFLKLTIGKDLARRISLTEEEHRLRLLFGTGEDAGLIQVSADEAQGPFLARRDKQGRYSLTVNAATADGLFALKFPPFTRSGISAAPAANGRSPRFAFKASDEMLEAE